MTSPDYSISFRKSLIRICLLHSILFFGTAVVLAAVFLEAKSFTDLEAVEKFWVSIVLFGFAGALLYFSRKCYVYIITDKYKRILADSDNKDSSAREKAMGYYAYLTLRPFGGIAIGPVAAMLILGGLSTLSKNDGGQGVANLSDAGRYLIMLAAFVGGYTSSDLFDALSTFGKNALKLKLKT